MSFRIRYLETILCAGLIFCAVPVANAQSSSAQSTSGGNHIIYSSPDGKVTASTSAPMVQAPQSQELEGPSDSQMNNFFAGPTPAPMIPLIPPQLLNNPENQDDSSSPADFRKKFRVPTGEQIMKVPTAEEMFGLPERDPDTVTKPAEFAIAQTNGPSPVITDEPAWAKGWFGKTEDVNSNRTDRFSGLFGGFFDTAARNDNGFGNHEWGSFGSPQTQAGGEQQQEQSWDAALSGSPSTPVAEPAKIAFSSPNLASSDGFSSQSPFLPPQVRSESSLDMLPQLPALPAVPGANQIDTQPPKAPSWTPKPPPWTQPQTPFGTAVQLNPQH
ncbi:MAG TPA: hypothetical protein VMF08_19435 [Candidatus Sulfotelmatobacter sp.]|nr:hypothetical protein [Candidatus Sulfotelmatobacter sp.]